MATELTSTTRPWFKSLRNREADLRAILAAMQSVSSTAVGVPESGLLPDKAGGCAEVSSTGNAAAPKTLILPYRGIFGASATRGWLGVEPAGGTIDHVAAAANPRIDVIYAEITTDGTLYTRRKTGVAAGSPVAPTPDADPLSAVIYPLYNALVATNGVITYTRRFDWTVPLGGIRPFTTNTRAPQYNGEYRCDATTGELYVGIGGVWLPVASPAVWAQWTPVLRYRGAGGGGAGIYNLGSTGSAIGRYMQRGKSLELRMQFKTGGTGINGGSGDIYTTLPPGFTGSAALENNVPAILGTTVGDIWAGTSYIPANSNEVNPRFPNNDGDPRIGNMRTAGSVGGVGSGRPLYPAAQTILSVLTFQGTIEI